jgi:hypothetical protein
MRDFPVPERLVIFRFHLDRARCARQADHLLRGPRRPFIGAALGQQEADRPVGPIETLQPPKNESGLGRFRPAWATEDSLTVDPTDGYIPGLSGRWGIPRLGRIPLFLPAEESVF